MNLLFEKKKTLYLWQEIKRHKNTLQERYETPDRTTGEVSLTVRFQVNLTVRFPNQ